MQYLSLVQDLHHIRERRFFDFNQGNKNNQTDITAYSLPGNTVNVTINSAIHTITIYVPNGTTITSLAPIFVLSEGATAKVGNTTQISGTTPNNFTNSVTYTVTAGDGISSQNWVVTVNTSLGISDPGSDERVLVYSNPSTGVFHVKMNDQEQTSINVYNLEGSLVFDKVFDIHGEQTIPIDLTGKPKGIYYLQLLTHKKNVQVKLILQ